MKGSFVRTDKENIKPANIIKALLFLPKEFKHRSEDKTPASKKAEPYSSMLFPLHNSFGS
ncbi:MAG: hypothetical protein HQK99_08200 [Nitrospirae bacterium]|nr:hypothetical protein [Nitrospirota bacterium]